MHSQPATLAPMNQPSIDNQPANLAPVNQLSIPNQSATLVPINQPIIPNQPATLALINQSVIPSLPVALPPATTQNPATPSNRDVITKIPKQGFFCTVCASGQRRHSQSKRTRSQSNFDYIFPNSKKKLFQNRKK
ncbi:hypothetical protein DPMN_163942 [Dreissena polymorpha]|uniref:Uncharacterized protein n=1 Tax=Dreissena polymorpha TaxID=45954 RepID=A0A9D4ET67_DREPO|nr:hypothetical protein DPMN_163942 [Dreissena polymorpha]